MSVTGNSDVATRNGDSAFARGQEPGKLNSAAPSAGPNANADMAPSAINFSEHSLPAEVQNVDFPEVAAQERSEVVELSPGIHRVLIRYGFMESPNLPRDLGGLQAKGIQVDPMQASYFLGRDTLVAAAAPKMPTWRMWLFLLLARNSVSATEFFRIPSDRVVELGVRVAI